MPENGPRSNQQTARRQTDSQKVRCTAAADQHIASIVLTSPSNSIPVDMRRFVPHKAVIFGLRPSPLNLCDRMSPALVARSAGPQAPGAAVAVAFHRQAQHAVCGRAAFTTLQQLLSVRLCEHLYRGMLLQLLVDATCQCRSHQA
jgi:hypothetical protein